MSAGTPQLVVTIDVEPDRQWDDDPVLCLRNLVRLPGLHALLHGAGARPTYLVTYSVCGDDACAAMLSRFAHTNGCDAAFWGRVAAKLSRLPAAWWIHSMRDNVGHLNRALLPWTDSVVALSPRHRRFVTEQLRVAPGKVEVVQNGVDWAEHQAAHCRDEVRSELGVSPEMTVIGTVGGLRPVKGYDVLIRAAALLLPQRPSVRLAIVGDGEQRGAVTDLAASEGVADRVLFLGARQDVPRLMSGFDVFVLSSHSEAFPISALQAMAAGLPVVATDIGCLSEIVEPEVTGLLVPPGRPEALSHALNWLAQDRCLAREMGRRGSEVVREGFPSRSRSSSSRPWLRGYSIDSLQRSPIGGSG